MPDTITVQIPTGYKGKVTIDVGDIEPKEKINLLEINPPRCKPKSKKLPKNWDSKYKPRGPDGRFIKDTLEHKKIKLDCQLKHSKELFEHGN